MVIASSLTHADNHNTSSNDINSAYTLFFLPPPDYGDRISQVGLFSFKVRATGEIYEGGVPISNMLPCINKWRHIKCLLTVANDGANSIFRTLRDNTDGAQDKFLSEIVRIMGKYPWCDGIDIYLEKGDGYLTHEISMAMLRNIYKPMTHPKSYQMQDCIDSYGCGHSTQGAIKNFFGHLDRFAGQQHLLFRSLFRKKQDINKQISFQSSFKH